MSGVQRRENKGIAYSDLTESGDDDQENDVAGLVVKDDDSDSKLSRARKYVVSDDRGFRKHLPSWCQLSRLSRNERICLVVGLVALVAIVVVFITVVIVARPKGTKPAPTGSGDGSGVEPGGGSGDGGGGQARIQWADVRLQSAVVPDTYDIHMSVDMDTFLVTGSVTISCFVRNDTDYVALHARDMTISNHHIMRGGTEMEHKAASFPENDFFVFDLVNMLKPGPIDLHLEFNYTLRESLAGFYKSSYVNANGDTVYLATTQFEPTDARLAFPCFDEPALKANFTMHMTHQARYRAWFNMPLSNRSEERPDGFVTSHFQTSVKMSTYLVAFIVSDFECVNDTIVSTSGRDIVIQVCSNPTVVSHTHYALEVAKDVVMFYEREFGVSYPLPKQDLFAIPDFSAGAMENWGLITYRETALLYEEGINPATSKQRVAVVIAHELAHQWFGDLVTMAWWDGLWLNEGFASFMEYIGTNSTEPSFNMLEQFIADDMVLALGLDGLTQSHPILQEVGHPSEINSLFDSISYSKGASVIRMLRNYIGVDAFRSGITSYLNRHQFGNAETHQLWESLQEQVVSLAVHPGQATVTDMMDTWTRQMGYPVFTVNQTTNTLIQTRFLAVQPEDKSMLVESPYDYIWKAPFNYLRYTGTDSNLVTLPLITAPTTSVDWPAASEGWIKANVEQTGFYRVNYEDTNWMAISSYLRNPQNWGESMALSAKDRAGLLDDAFALSYAGILDTNVAMTLSIYLAWEREYLPWSVAASWFYTLDDLLSLTPHYGHYADFVGKLFGSAMDGLSTSSSNLSHLDIYLRSIVLQAAAHYGNTEVIQNATEIFRDWMLHDISVDPDLKTLVYGVGISEGGVEEWDFVWDKYNQSTNSYEKRLYLRALARSKQPWILNRYLNYSITKLRAQDTQSVIVYISRNIYGRYLAWNFVRSNWPYLSETYNQSSFFDRFIRYITASFATEYELQQLEDFFAAHPDAGSATRGFRQAIETVRGNIAWLSTYRKGLFG